MGSRRRLQPASPLQVFHRQPADWVQAESVDGVIDSLREKFTLDIPSLKPGEHLLVVRAADSANNTGVAKVILK